MTTTAVAELSTPDLEAEIDRLQTIRAELVEQIRVLTAERNDRQAKAALAKKFAQMGDRERQLLGVASIPSAEAFGRTGAQGPQ